MWGAPIKWRTHNYLSPCSPSFAWLPAPFPSFGGIPRSAGFAIPPQGRSGFIIRYGVANPVLGRGGLQIRHNWVGKENNSNNIKKLTSVV